MARNKKHVFVGEAEGNALAEWLNGGRGKSRDAADRRKVAQVILDLQALSHSGETATELFRKKLEAAAQAGEKRIVLNVNDLRPSERYTALARSIDRLLADCWMRPRVTGHDEPAGRSEPWITFGWVYKSKRSEAAHLLMRLIALNLGDRIRICEKASCGQWFFAKSPREKFHATVCATRHRQTSEEWKAHRREWYEKHRATQKAREQRRAQVS